MADAPATDATLEVAQAEPGGHRQHLETIAGLGAPQPLGPAATAVELADRLPPDIDYCLDCEQDWGGIGFDDRSFVSLFDENTLSWFLPLTRRGASGFAGIVKRRHAQWRETAPVADRMALDWGGIKALRWLFDGVVADFSYEVIHRQGVGDIPEGDLTAIVAAMDVTDHACVRRFTDCAGPILQRSLDDIAIAGIDAFLAARDRLDGIYAEQAARINERSRRLNAALRRYADHSVPQAVKLEAGVPIRTIEQKRKEKRLRKAINRSYALLSSIAGRKTARACIDGDVILVEGDKFDFRLRVANLRSTAHGAVEVFVTDKNTIELAALCVYMDETPALDQMAAFILNVASGNEDEIVKRANIIRATQAAAENVHFRQIREHVERPRPSVPTLSEPLPEPRSPEDFLPEVKRKLACEIDRTVWRPLAAALGCGWLEFADKATEDRFPASAWA